MAIRREIIEKQKLEAVISMPSGVFKPYAGVSTAVLVFTKTNSGGTDRVWFYDMHADGYSLDDKRQPVAENDIPDLLNRWDNRDAETDRSRTDQSFMVSLADIQANGYDLSINRYKEVVYAEQAYETPKAIMESIRQLDELRNVELNELESVSDVYVIKAMTTIREKIRREIEQVPEEKLPALDQFLRTLLEQPTAPDTRRRLSLTQRDFGGRFDHTNVRDQAYE